ncbi:MAG: DUF418 domain-containing protein [Alcanivoracaceae bacterium]|nr:DUF418 domain-containing protein [Alcanivoracaceae bacterium]
MKQRIIGFDVARALAVFGMVVVNFKIAMGAKTGSTILLWFASLFEGRASALFVVLAGIGITFLTNADRKSNNSSSIKHARTSLIKRGLLLVVIGLAYSPIWVADILHFYGFYFLIAAMIFTISNRKLLMVSVFVTLLFPLLMMLFDYDKGWDWSSFTYHGFWTFDGMVRHIFFNGFHPVFPWAAFLVFGMWLGRQDLTVNKVRNKLFLYASMIWLFTETGFYWLRHSFTGLNSISLSAEDARLLFSTSIIPPFPQYILAAGSLAVMVIMSCLYISERYSKNKLILSLYQTGQLALTLYVAHVIIGMGFLDAINSLKNQTIDFSLFSTLVFCLTGMIFSVLWLKHFKTGPLEWIFRKIVK